MEVPSIAKKALVTGGSRGIGRAICLALAEHGYDVAFTYEKAEDCAKEVVREVEARGRNAVAFSCDAGDWVETDAMVKDAIAALGGLDAVICNAGISHVGLLTDMTPEQWQRVMDVNLNSVFYTTKPAISHFVSQKKGHIVTVSSMWGQVGGSCEVCYSAAKAGVIGYSKALAKELAPSGILVNCVAPGVIETDMISMFTEEDKICLKEETPLGRLGTAEEVANLVVFLVDGGCDFLTGQVIAPNGGLVV